MSGQQKSPGQIAYEAYAATFDWKSAVNGSPLPQWEQQAGKIRQGWEIAANAAREPLQRFKTYTHDQLDAMRVPASVPESIHTREGCRIGGRLEWVARALGVLRCIALGERAGMPDEDEGHGVPDRISLTADDMQAMAKEVLA